MFRTYKPDGSLQFDSDIQALALRTKGSVTTGARQFSNTAASTAIIPSQGSGIVAVSCTSGIANCGYASSAGGSVYQCAGAQGTTVNYWVFDGMGNYAAAPVGLNLYDGSGKLTYTSDRDIMNVYGLFSRSQGSVALPSGRSYAVVLPYMAGIEATTDAVYRNGTPYVGSGGGGSANWSRRVNGKLYGFQIDGGNTLKSVDVSNDDVIAYVNTGTSPAPAQTFWNIDLVNAVVVDVTGF